ncbi:hypothetical protein ACJX0J_029197, partial [Zea mays]
QATVETTADHGTEGNANFALVCTQDWLRRSTPIDIQENIEELAIIEKGIIVFHHFFLHGSTPLIAELIEEFGNGGKGKRTEVTSTSKLVTASSIAHPLLWSTGV